jgi:hypothetical protein
VIAFDVLSGHRHGGSGGDGAAVGTTVTGGSSYGSVTQPALPGSSGGGTGAVSFCVYMYSCVYKSNIDDFTSE